MKRIPFIFLGLLLVLATFWAFQRGAQDFSVFFAAFKFVAHGEGMKSFNSTPDRFLYAPGFAWLGAPLGILPRNIALFIWCLAKVALVVWMLKSLYVEKWIGALAFLCCARPLLIDFQYGQVNLLILGASIWALKNWYELTEKNFSNPFRTFAVWFVFACAAVTKIFPLSFFALPFIRPFLNFRLLKSKKWILPALGAFCGFVFLILLPAVSFGVSSAISFLNNWAAALNMRGYPMESHNQSFMAFLSHYISGEPTYSILFGGNRNYSSYFHLTDREIWLGMRIWLFSWLGITGLWLVFSKAVEPARWIAISLGLLIVPSYIIWKPYFVFSVGLFAVAINDVYRMLPSRNRNIRFFVLGIFFFLFNLSTYEVIGYEWAGRLEAASTFLFVHLLLLGLVWHGPEKKNVTEQRLFFT